jgi:sugar lactone lactonase YvrE
MHRSRSLSIALLFAALAFGACSRKPPAPAGPSRVVATAGFQTPEAVRYDADLDIYFVSNINGFPSAPDGNGFISRLGPDGALLDTAFIRGGVNGVVLNAPKGMTVVGDTLWVTDIDAVRGFNKRTGAPVASVDFAAQGAQFLNDIATGPDGALYVTDSGLRIDSSGMTHPGPDRVFRLGPDRTMTTAAQGDTLGGPNGITWDPVAGRFLIVPLAAGSVFGWAPGDSLPAVITTGPGVYDGVERLADGRFLISSWADSSVYTLDSTAALVRYIVGVPSPADIGLDTRRNRVAIPIFTENRVEIWDIR